MMNSIIARIHRCVRHELLALPLIISGFTCSLPAANGLITMADHNMLYSSPESGSGLGRFVTVDIDHLHQRNNDIEGMEATMLKVPGESIASLHHYLIGDCTCIQLYNSCFCLPSTVSYIIDQFKG